MTESEIPIKRGRGVIEDDNIGHIPPYIIRRRLNDMKQNEGESLEHFANKIWEMTIGGYPDTSEDDCQFLAVYAFLKGCSNRQASQSVMVKDPPALENALYLLKNEISYQKRISDLESRMDKLETSNFEIKVMLDEIIELLKPIPHPQENQQSDSPPLFNNNLPGSHLIEQFTSERTMPLSLNV